MGNLDQNMAGAEGISAPLYARLHKALAESPAFASHADLKALFNDARLKPWRDEVPYTETVRERVGRVIDGLHNQENVQGESALALLLRVVSERTPHGTALRHHLARLAWELGGISHKEDKTPYLGLRTFDEADTDFFFGRGELIARLLDKAAGATFLAVLGPSGSGKSSVVRAGLLPALRRGELPGSETWRYLVLRPGARPLDALAAAMAWLQASDLSRVSALRQTLVNDERALLLAVEMLRTEQPETRLVLVVDQFEELWTQAPTDQEARKSFQESEQQPFIRLLLAAAAAPDGSLLVLLTMRADFLHRAAEQPELARWIAEHDIIVSPMQPEELSEIIIQPAEVVGGAFEPGLVEALIAEVVGEPGALPLLEYTLLELWQARQGSEMTWAAYRALGGVEGALAARAEAILDKHYRDERQEDLRHLLLRLIQPGEGVADTRRRALLVDLVPQGSSTEEVQALIKPLTDERLLVAGQDPGTSEETVEVAHEALIRAWPTLRTWIDEARANLVQHLHLEQAAKEWERNAQDPAFLWTGLRLANIEVWTSRARPRLNQRDERFLQASRNQKEALEAESKAQALREEATRLERESLLKEKARAEVQARGEAEARGIAARRNLRVVSLLLVLALLLAGLAWHSQRVATRRADEAQRQSLAGESLFLLAQDEQKQSLLLALAAVYGSSEPSLLVTRAVRASLDKTQIKSSLSGHTAGVSRMAWSPDGQQVLTGSYDGSVRIWDVASRRTLYILAGHTAEVYAVAWSPDGQQVLTGSGDGSARIWDAASGQMLHILAGHTAEVYAVAWSPDGQQVLTGSGDRSARIWDAASGQMLYILADHPGGVWTVAWSPDGQQVLTGSGDGSARIWDAVSGQILHVLEGHTSAVYVVAWSPDGQQVLTGSGDGSTRIWDAVSGGLLNSLAGHTRQVSSVAWSPNGQRVLTGSWDGSARIWDAASSGLLHILTGHTAAVSDATWSADGQRVLTGSGDGSARIWDAASGHTLYTLSHPGGVASAAWSPDGQQVLTGSGDGSVQLWDGVSGQSLFMLAGHASGVSTVAWSPDGQQVLTGSGDGTARIWNATDGEPLHTLTGHTYTVSTVVWSPDGQQVLTGSGDGSARIWNATSGESLHTLAAHTDWVSAVAWSADGQRVLTGSWDGSARIWDAASGELLHTLAGHTGPVYAAAWSPGQQVLTGSGDGTARIWDVTGGQLLYTFTGHAAEIYTVAWSPDGQQMLTGSGDSSARIWDVTGGQSLYTLAAHTAAISGAVWSADGKQVLTGSRDGTACIWDATSGRLLHTLVGHTDWVYAVAWSPDGQQVLTGSWDNSARIWDVASGAPLDTLEGHAHDVSSVAWSPDGQQVLTGSGDGTARIWVVDEALLSARLTERTCNILSDDEIRVEIPAWRGCDAELAAVAQALAEYYALRGQ